MVGVHRRRLHLAGRLRRDRANSYPAHADLPGQTQRTTWNLKATGSYDAAWGIRISPVMRHQSGINYGREISVPASAATAFGLTIPTSTIYADDPKDNRQDNIWVFDVRAEKTVNMGSRLRTRLFLDFFNIANSSASETITEVTGANYQRPANDPGPAHRARRIPLPLVGRIEGSGVQVLGSRF